MSQWSVYFVRCARGELYAGITTDVERRIAEHGAGRGARYLRGRGPLSLVYRRRVGEQSLALRIEHRLKQLSKSEKESIVSSSPSRRRLLNAVGCVEPRAPSRSIVRSPRRSPRPSIAEKRARPSRSPVP